MFQGGASHYITTHAWPCILAHGIRATIFLDDGSTISLRAHQLAGFLGLVGISFVEYMEVAGKNPEQLEMMMYKLKITDKHGKLRNLWLLGLDKITFNPRLANIEKAYQLFPHVKAVSLTRPTREVSILIGQDNVALLPTGGSGQD